MTPGPVGATRPRVVVVGGGISGLAAAWAVSRRRPDAEVLVLESAAQVGGKVALGSLAGVNVDVGAEALLARRPEGLALLAELGLTEDRISPLSTSAAIWAGGARHELPARTMMGIPSDLAAVAASGVLGAHSLAGLAAEPGHAPLAPLVEDVAVGTLVRSRLGDEVVDRLVEPLLGGVYAGRSDQLSLRATMPALATRLEAGGSLVAAARAVVDAGGRHPATGPVFTSLHGGLGRLPQVLAARPELSVRTGVTVRAIRRRPAGFVLDCGAVPEPALMEADAVILAVPAAKAARLLAGPAPAAAAELAAIETASMAITTLAYPLLDLPAGSGLLVGAREGRAVKAVTISSQKWPLPSTGLTLLRASVGRVGEAGLLQRDDAELVALVRGELRVLYGIEAEPIDALVTRWGGGLPQYAVGHVERVARIRTAVATVPGLAVCGASLDGVGIPACIAAAGLAADSAIGSLAPARPDGYRPDRGQ